MRDLPSGRGRRAGFTLIELMVVLAIVALLVMLAAPRYMGSVDRARESALKENLFQMRAAIDKFYADRSRYPTDLRELVEQRYLRSIPPDPLTDRSDTWVAVAVKEQAGGGISNVRSGASGRALDGSQYASW
jgi:general secretion pathway protein G